MPRKKRTVLEEIELRITGSDLLSDEEKAEALKRAKDHVLKTRKEKAIDAYFDAAVAVEERSHIREENLEDFTVDLPKYSYMIAIDNVRYYHGVTYEIPYSKARSMAEIQGRAWEHDREINGKRRHGDATRQPLNRTMDGRTGAITTSHIQRGI